MSAFLKHFPKSPALEKIVENMAKKVAPETLTLVNGATEGLMTGDIFGSISKAADAALKDTLIAKIKTNFTIIVKAFENKLNTDVNISVFTNELLRAFEMNFPDKSIQNVLEETKNDLMEMQKKTETNSGGGGQAITCKDKTITLNESDEIADFVNKSFEIYVCELNHPKKIKELYDILNSKIVNNFQIQTQDVFRQIRETNEQTGGGFPAGSLFNSAKSLVSKTGISTKNFSDITKLVPSSSSDGSASSDAALPKNDNLVKETYKKFLEKILNKSIKIEAKTLSYKLHNLTKNVFDDYFPDLSNDISVFLNTFIQQNQQTKLGGSMIGNLANVVTKAVNNPALKQFAKKASDQVANSPLLEQAKEQVLDGSLLKQNTEPVSDIQPTGEEEQNIKEKDDANAVKIKDIKTQKQLEYFMVKTLNSLFCKIIVNKLSDFAIKYRNTCQNKILSILNAKPTQITSKPIPAPKVGGKKRITKKRRKLRKKTTIGITKKRLSGITKT